MPRAAPPVDVEIRSRTVRCWGTVRGRIGAAGEAWLASRRGGWRFGRCGLYSLLGQDEDAGFPLSMGCVSICMLLAITILVCLIGVICSNGKRRCICTSRACSRVMFPLCVNSTAGALAIIRSAKSSSVAAVAQEASPVDESKTELVSGLVVRDRCRRVS